MRDLPIRRLRMPAETTIDTVTSLTEEFPTVSIERRGAAVPGDAVIEAEAWCRAPSFAPFDDAVERATTDRVVLAGAAAASAVAAEVLTRYQRHLDRRTEGSTGRAFDRVLAVHRKLHERKKPLAHLDLEHSLDTWQWLLRLAPHAGLSLHLAAIFHDIERLDGAREERLEHRAAAYEAFKQRHATRGSDIAFDVLLRAGVDRDVAVRARASSRATSSGATTRRSPSSTTPTGSRSSPSRARATSTPTVRSRQGGRSATPSRESVAPRATGWPASAFDPTSGHCSRRW